MYTRRRRSREINDALNWKSRIRSEIVSSICISGYLIVALFAIVIDQRKKKPLKFIVKFTFTIKKNNGGMACRHVNIWSPIMLFNYLEDSVCLQISVNIGAIRLFSSFSTRSLMLSCTRALCGFRCASNLLIDELLWSEYINSYF